MWMKPSACSDREQTTQMLERTRENGLLIGKGGLYNNVLRLSPMLNITKPDVDEAIRLLRSEADYADAGTYARKRPADRQGRPLQQRSSSFADAEYHQAGCG